MTKMLVYLLLVFSTLYTYSDSHLASSLHQLSSHYFKTKQLDLAKKYSKLAIAEGSSQALLDKGYQYTKKGNYSKAKQYVKQAAYKRNPFACMTLAILDHGIENAVTTYDKITKKLGSNCDVLFQKIPHLSKWTVLADICFAMGKNKQAEECYRQALEYPKPQVESSYYKDNIYSNIAYFYKKQKRLELAMHFYQKALDTGECSNNALADLAKTCYKQGKLDLTRALCYRKVFDSNIEYHAYLALIEHAKGDTNAVQYHLKYAFMGTEVPATITAQAFDKLIKKHIATYSETICLTWVGYGYFERKQYDQALPYFLQAIALNLENRYTINFVRYDVTEYLVKIYIQQGNFDLAKKAYQQIMEEFPDKARYGLAGLAKKQGKYEEAEKYYKFLEESSDARFKEDACKHLTTIYKKQQKFDLANIYMHKLKVLRDENYKKMKDLYPGELS